MKTIYLYLFSLIVFLIFPIKAQESNDFFDPMDVFELEWASDPQVSSDGETIWVATAENGDTVIELQYNSQDADVSQQRCPNGFGIFQSNIEPSPGMLNICE